jgi:hypothetical protein
MQATVSLMYRSTSPARKARLKAALMAAMPRRRTVPVYPRVTIATLLQLQEERRLYPVSLSMSAVCSALISEALAFRRMHRSAPRPPRGTPFPGL